MSKLDQARETIVSEIKNRVAASAFASIPIAYPNHAFSQPPNAPWVRVSLIGGDSNQASLGLSPTDRHVGILQFDVVVPEDSGIKTGNEIGEFLGSIFDKKQFLATPGNSLNFKVPSYIWMGTTQGGGVRLMVRIPYRRDVKDS